MKNLLIPFISLLLISFGSAAATDAQKANQLYVEAYGAMQIDQEGLAYDKFETIIENYPDTTAANLSVDIVKELKPLNYIQGVKRDRSKYPQSNFKEYISSVISAIESKDYAYFLAYLRSPSPIDKHDFNRILSNINEAEFQQFLVILKKLQSESELVSEHPYFERSVEYTRDTTHYFKLDSEISFVEKDGSFYLLD